MSPSENIRLTVELPPEAHGAMHAASVRTRDSCTDVVSRALLFYDMVMEQMLLQGVNTVRVGHAKLTFEVQRGQ